MTRIFVGVIEDRTSDPLKLGRCKVRVVGLHSDNKSELPTADLPWATVQQPVYSAAISGIGHSPLGPVEGSWVTIVFLDDQFQYPLITGSVAGIPGLTTNLSETETFEDAAPTVSSETTSAPSVVTTESGGVLTTSDGTPVTTGDYNPQDKYIGNMTKNDTEKLKKVIADKESSGGKNLDNGLGFIGKYQLGCEALETQGYIKAGTSKNSRAALGARNFNKAVYDPANWTGKDGMTSADAFKASAPIQDKTMDANLKYNFKILSPNTITTDTPAEKTAGLLAVAHLIGPGAARKVVITGTPKTDGFGTSSDTYYQAGYAAVAGKPTVEVPTQQNMDKPAVDKTLPEKNDSRRYDVPTSAQPKTAAKQGFVDPNGKYPLKDHLKEPDTNRLARAQNIGKTIVADKETSRERAIPIANCSTTWDQQPIPYNAEYPYNHVYQSESGHVLEFDDTDGAERIHLYHTTGTFNEIDSEGNQTEVCVGARTVIVEHDELVYIKGSGHITVMGDITIKAAGSCQIQVTGDANIHVAGSMYQQVDGDYNLKVGGRYALQSGGMGTWDSPNVFINSGNTAKGVQAYSPSIAKIEAPTREEAAAVLLEDSPVPIQPDPQAEPVTPQAADPAPPAETAPPAVTSDDCNFVDLSASTQLTANYTLGALCKGHPFPFKTGQHGLSDLKIACNMKQLAINVIEPLRAAFAGDKFFITSCFREAGSKISKSSKISQHELGSAGDFVCLSYGKSRPKFYRWAQQIRDMINFDQLLLEYRSANKQVWIHVSFNPAGNRREILTLNDDKVYGKGLILLD